MVALDESQQGFNSQFLHCYTFPVWSEKVKSSEYMYCSRVWVNNPLFAREK